MSVSGVYGSSGTVWYGRLDTRRIGLFVDQLNDKFSSVKIKSGNVRTAAVFTDASSLYLRVSPDYLTKAMDDEDAAELLNAAIKKLSGAKSALTDKMKSLGKELSSCGFSIDKRGNLTLHGTSRADGLGKDFKIELGNIRDSFADLNHRLTNSFESQAFRLLHTTV